MRVTPEEFAARYEAPGVRPEERAVLLLRYGQELARESRSLARRRALLALELREPPFSMSLAQVAWLLQVSRTRAAQLEHDGRDWLLVESRSL